MPATYKTHAIHLGADRTYGVINTPMELRFSDDDLIRIRDAVRAANPDDSFFQGFVAVDCDQDWPHHGQPEERLAVRDSQVVVTYVSKLPRSFYAQAFDAETGRLVMSMGQSFPALGYLDCL